MHVCVLLALCLPARLWAVGAFFVAQDGNKQVQTVGARAFLVRNKTMEDLLLQVGFSGSASEFAWVIPVPARPTLRVGDPAVFDELQSVFMPRILPKGPFSAPQKPNVEPPKPVRMGETIILPPDWYALSQWLKTNHYQMPAEAIEIIQDYVRRRWYFIVVRVHTEPERFPRWLQPIWIAFESRRASFPLRISSLNGNRFATQLYVASDTAVKAPGFVEASQTSSPLRTEYKLNEFPLFFQAIRRDSRLTELRSMVDPKQITSDLVIVPKNASRDERVPVR